MKELTQSVVQANKDHQYALRVYTERLEAELQAVDKLLAAAELPEDDAEVDAGGTISVPGAMKAESLFNGDIPFEDSPFAADAQRRERYLKSTVIHPMKAPELEALSEAVRSENYRLYAMELQRRGQQPFVGLDEHPPGYFEMNKHGIDWERIASKVSSAGSSSVQRTATECEIKWLGERHPQINHSQWSQPEIDRLKELVGDDPVEGHVDWVDIATRLGTNRTPIDCMRHAISRRVHTWTPESDNRLLEAVQRYGTDCWQLVARMVSEDATASQCQNRYLRTLDSSLKRGPWNEQEDAQLRRAVEVYGHSWVDVAAFVPNRSNEQCRDRWQETVNPAVVKTKWTETEDQALLAVVERIGEGKWKETSRLVGSGRTDNMCRNRYQVLMKRKQRASAASPAPKEASGFTASSSSVTDGSIPSQSTRPTPVQGPAAVPSAGRPVEYLEIQAHASQSGRSDLTADTAGNNVAASIIAAQAAASIINVQEQPPAQIAPARPKPKPRRRVPGPAIEGEITRRPVGDGGAAQASDEDMEQAVPVEGKGKGKEVPSGQVEQSHPSRARKITKRAASTEHNEEAPATKRRKTSQGQERSGTVPSKRSAAGLLETSAPKRRRTSGRQTTRSRTTDSAQPEDNGQTTADAVIGGGSEQMPSVTIDVRGRDVDHTHSSQWEDSGVPNRMPLPAPAEETGQQHGSAGTAKRGRAKATPRRGRAVSNNNASRRSGRLASKLATDVGPGVSEEDTTESRAKGSLRESQPPVYAPATGEIGSQDLSDESSVLSSPPGSPT